MLTQSLDIHNFTLVRIHGMNKSVISFHGRSTLAIRHSDQVSVEGICFSQSNVRPEQLDSWNQQQGLALSDIQIVNITNCCFVGINNQQLDFYNQEINSGDLHDINSNISAVKINAKSSVLDRVTARGNYGRVLYIESHCDVAILNSELAGNVGDVAFINSTKVEIIDSQFHSNIGRVLTVSSVTTFIIQCSITNNINPRYDDTNSIVLIIPYSSFSTLKASTIPVTVVHQAPTVS